LTEPTIDLGAIAVEHFLLAVDPYPRAPGAELPADVGEPGAEASKEGRDESWRISKRYASRPRSISTDSIPNPRDTGSGETDTIVEAMRPRNAERKRGFLRNILNRK